MLGKIGAGVAAPFTGGASLAAIPAIDAIGAAAGAGSQASAQNRGTKLQALMDQDLMRLRVRDDQRTMERDALKKLAQTGYLKAGGSTFQPSTPYSYSFAPRAASDAQKQAASTLEEELMKRMAAGPMPLSDYAQQMKPGFWEKFGGILGAGASVYGAASRRQE